MIIEWKYRVIIFIAMYNAVIYIYNVYLQKLWNKRHHPEKGELPPWKVSNNAESKERTHIVFFAREKNPWSKQGESLTCWICLEEFNSKAYVYGPTLWWAYETKPSLAEYFQRHYKLNCFCFSFTKEFQQRHNNNFLFHILYITYICIETTLKTARHWRPYYDSH